MICPRCHNTNIVLEIIDEATVTLRCIMGHSTDLYKYRNTWETSEQRMKRMEYRFICVKCKSGCITYKERIENNERTLCDDCRGEDTRRDRRAKYYDLH
jgi:transcription initiation factor TFIIIB Brf1 subunit/transcription initiation factor TFIIB